MAPAGGTGERHAPAPERRVCRWLMSFSSVSGVGGSCFISVPLSLRHAVLSERLESADQLDLRSIREPRQPEVRSGRRSAARPVTMSAISLPAAGPMPKPWPEKPVAMWKPGMLSIGGNDRNGIGRDVDIAGPALRDLGLCEDREMPSGSLASARIGAASWRAWDRARGSIRRDSPHPSPSGWASVPRRGSDRPAGIAAIAIRSSQAGGNRARSERSSARCRRHCSWPEAMV